MTNGEYINQIVEIGNTLQIQPNSPKGQTLKKCIELLSAVPEREKGEWIPVYGKNGKTIMSYKCSKCEFHPKHAIITDFCGGCGADMRGE